MHIYIYIYTYIYMYMSISTENGRDLMQLKISSIGAAPAQATSRL